MPWELLDFLNKDLELMRWAVPSFTDSDLINKYYIQGQGVIKIAFHNLKTGQKQLVCFLQLSFLLLIWADFTLEFCQYYTWWLYFQIALWMEEADTNRDGVLSYQEFKQSLIMKLDHTSSISSNNNTSPV